MSLKIINDESNPPEDLDYFQQFTGGAVDGMTFKYVKVTFSDGTQGCCMISDSYPGKYFKYVLVPWDFQHECIVP